MLAVNIVTLNKKSRKSRRKMKKKIKEIKIYFEDGSVIVVDNIQNQYYIY